jgi:hypothetical protein
LVKQVSQLAAEDLKNAQSVFFLSGKVGAVPGVADNLGGAVLSVDPAGRVIDYAGYCILL